LTGDLRFFFILDQYESKVTTSEVPKNSSKDPWWNPCQFCSTNPELFNVLFILILIVLLILTLVVISSCFCLYKMDKRYHFPTRSGAIDHPFLCGLLEEALRDSSIHLGEP